MIKGGWFPANRGMAALAIIPKHSGVDIIIRVACSTIRWGAFELLVGMTTVTSQRGVLPFQLENGHAMVKNRSFPIIGSMTTRTISAQTTGMDLLVRVTGETIGWCLEIIMILMAINTFHTIMLTIQCKPKESMWK